MTESFSRIDGNGQETAEPSLASRTVRQARAERMGTALSMSIDGARNVRLWDCVDKAWLRAPVPDYQAYQMCLREVVIKCSACAFTTVFDGGVKKHVAKVLVDGMKHQGATITVNPILPGQVPSQVCSGCGSVFMVRKNIGQRHLASVLASPSPHQGIVEEIRLQRFSLGPGQEVVLGRAVVYDGRREAQSVTQPEASQEERSQGARKRNQHRGRNRRKRHGATTR